MAPSSEQIAELRCPARIVPADAVPAFAPFAPARRLDWRCSALSASIHEEDTRSVVGQLPVDLEVECPDVMWLVSPEQLVEHSKMFRRTLAALRHRVPNLRQIHLFYSGPTGGAIVIGQAINPRMNAPVALYEYDRQRESRYANVINLPLPDDAEGRGQ